MVNVWVWIWTELSTCLCRFLFIFIASHAAFVSSLTPLDRIVSCGVNAPQLRYHRLPFLPISLANHFRCGMRRCSCGAVRAEGLYLFSMSPAFRVTLSPRTLSLGIRATDPVGCQLSCRQVVAFSQCYLPMVSSESYPFQGIVSLFPVLLTIGASHPLLETAPLRNPRLCICQLN